MKEDLRRYYQFHARIYDATRWSFLFGRKTLISRIADFSLPDKHPQRILEVGCGTGINLARLSKLFPEAQIMGLDLSADMLDRSRKRLQKLRQGHANTIRLEQMTYGPSFQAGAPFDLIVFSYALSMMNSGMNSGMNPGWSEVIQCAARDLTTGGLIAVVDFHDAMVNLFKEWMRMNHVKMEGHLLPELETCFAPVFDEKHPAFGGLWQYMLFIGKKV